MLVSRWFHYGVLIVVAALLTVPNLGAHSLWDMDEGVNAECAREMAEAGTWVVPTFNWELRTAKPVLLYWLQRFAFLAFGVSEWSARLPSVLLGIGTVLVTYELGRRMFDALTGLLAGVALASAVQFCMLSHAATPDAPLIFFTTLTFYLVWCGQENNGRSWLIIPAIPCGLAVLSKGPVGLALPGLAFVLFFLWNREWRRLFDHRLLFGIVIFLLVVGPWVGLVAAETKGEWLAKFLQNENVNRITTAQENHSGWPIYYVLCVLVLFAPWSSVIGVTLWFGVRGTRLPQSPSTIVDGLSSQVRAHRFLLCWFCAYLIPFSLIATKLPNYIGPLYPALALLSARFLMQWRAGEIAVPKWVMIVATAGVSITGLCIGVGFMVVSGALKLDIKGMRLFPDLLPWAMVGLIPILASPFMRWCVQRQLRGGYILALSLAAVGLIGIIAAGPVVVIDRYKAAKELVLTSGARQPERDIRLAALEYFQDSQSIVFYAERRVEVLQTLEQARTFLAMPHPSYLFIPEALWQAHFDATKYRIAARKYDFYRNAVILVVTNE